SCACNTAAIALLAAIALPVRAQSSQPVAIRAGRLFDSKSGRILENQIDLVDDEKISAVGPADQEQSPAGAQVIDIGKATVRPGLIDGQDRKSTRLNSSHT